MNMKRCWITGSILLVIVIVSLGAFIPWCNHTISQTENELATLEWDREMRFRNLQWFLTYGLKEGQSVIGMYSLRLLKEDKEMQSAIGRRLNDMRKGLSKLHSTVTGQIASEELKNKWAKMDIQQLHNEVSLLADEENFSELFDDIKKKKLELAKTEGFRMLVLVGTTMFQVIGLIMISIPQYFREYAKQKLPNKELKTAD